MTVEPNNIESSDIARFWSKVRRGAPDECWPWMAGRTTRGYGAFYLQGKQVGAHRVAYELTYGPLPAQHQACHRCDNPPCCNPAHLFGGTGVDNALDRQAKGRGRPPRGSINGAAKLTEAQVRAIISAPRTYGSGAVLARRYSISQVVVSQIRSGKRWQHVRGDDAT